jgi:predicted HicB family RNase H-like nuclease
MAHRYITARIFTTTHRLLKIEAAKRGIPLSQLLDEAVRNELSPVKSAKKRGIKNES